MILLMHTRNMTHISENAFVCHGYFYGWDFQWYYWKLDMRPYNILIPAEEGSMFF